MKKIKEYNYLLKNGDITIRSIKNSDMEYYKNWFKKGHILENKINTVTEDDIEKWIFSDTKSHLILIIEINEKPVGEITLWVDSKLIINDKMYRKPFYCKNMIFYENVSDIEINNILNIFLKSISIFKLKLGTIYIMIDENIVPNYKNNYTVNGFKEIKKDNYKTKLDKNFIKMGIENPYDKLKMLIRKL
jgi:hypothetical protein